MVKAGYVMNQSAIVVQFGENIREVQRARVLSPRYQAKKMHSLVVVG